MARWLGCHVGLSEATKVAYGGEVRRFGEYLANANVRHVQELKSSLWENYLALLMIDRQGVASCRRDKLKRSSALQAGRITRSFLRYCWTQGWLGWVPDLGNRKGADTDHLDEPVTIPPLLVEILQGNWSETDERIARARVAIDLAFWGALKPREISVLRGGELKDFSAQFCQLSVAGRLGPTCMPSDVMEHYRHYSELRERRAGSGVGEHVPLLSQLGSYAPLTGNSIWQLLKSWPPAPTNPTSGSVLGSKRIRDTYIALGAREPAELIQALQREGGIRGLPLGSGNVLVERPPGTVTNLVMQNLRVQSSL